MWLNLHHSLMPTNLMGEMLVSELVEDAGVKICSCCYCTHSRLLGSFPPHAGVQIAQEKVLALMFALEPFYQWMLALLYRS